MRHSSASFQHPSINRGDTKEKSRTTNVQRRNVMSSLAPMYMKICTRALEAAPRAGLDHQGTYHEVLGDSDLHIATTPLRGVAVGGPRDVFALRSSGAAEVPCGVARARVPAVTFACSPCTMHAGSRGALGGSPGGAFAAALADLTLRVRRTVVTTHPPRPRPEETRHAGDSTREPRPSRRAPPIFT